MIVAVCSDGGSPGVTTLALLLGLHWGATVVEADPSGGDLRLRLRPARAPQQVFLDDRPGLVDLAAAARAGAPPVAPGMAHLVSGVAMPMPAAAGVLGGVRAHAQVSSLGVAVVAGPPQAEEFQPMAGLWAPIATALAASRELVVADLGRLQPGHPAWPVAVAAEVVIVMAWPTVEGLHHLRERVTWLSGALGEGRSGSQVAVAALNAHPGRVGRAGDGPADDVRAVLEARGLPVSTLASVAVDVAAAEQVRDGEVTGRLRRSRLWRSTALVGTQVLSQWPTVAAAAARTRSGPGVDETPPGRIPGPFGQSGTSWGETHVGR